MQTVIRVSWSWPANDIRMALSLVAMRNDIGLGVAFVKLPTGWIRFPDKETGLDLCVQPNPS